MKSFEVKNFKSVATLQNVPIKPITLIYGANSSGKSSIIHSFLLLNDIMRTGNGDINLISTSWDNLDIGGFSQYIYKHDFKNQLIFKIKLANLENTEIILEIKSKTSDIGEALQDTTAFINTFEIIIQDTKLIKFLKIEQEDLYDIQYFNENHSSWKEYIKKILNPNLNFNELYPLIVNNIKLNLNKFIKSHSINNFNFDAIDNSFETLEIKRFDEEIKLFKNFISEIFNNSYKNFWNDMDTSLNSINYIGPLRDYPPRIISNENKNNQNKTWSILLENEEVRNKINKWVGNEEFMNPSYEFVVEHKVNPEKIVMEIINLISNINISENYVPEELDKIFQIQKELNVYGQEILNLSTNSYDVKDINKLIKLLLNKNYESFYSQLNLIDKRTKTNVSLRDVGVGISQILPVLVNAYSPNNKIVAIEQPELHLHPKLQSELADVFIENAIGENKKTFLIETHSEHLLLRIMRRIRETTDNSIQTDNLKITADDVQILFVMPSINNEGSVIKKINLDKNGEMIDKWPGGFFEEGFKERFGF